METVVKKWGNSLGIRIPGLIARKLSLRDGSFVDINDKGRRIIIEPIERNNLLDMVNAITDQNMHDEVESTGPVGKEAW
jgi:antitoxin MazE